MKVYHALLVRFEDGLIKELTVQTYKFPRTLGETLNHFGVKFKVGAIADNSEELIAYGNKLTKAQNKKIRQQNKSIRERNRIVDNKFFSDIMNDATNPLK